MFVWKDFKEDEKFRREKGEITFLELFDWEGEGKKSGGLKCFLSRPSKIFSLQNGEKTGLDFVKCCFSHDLILLPLFKLQLRHSVPIMHLLSFSFSFSFFSLYTTFQYSTTLSSQIFLSFFLFLFFFSLYNMFSFFFSFFPFFFLLYCRHPIL